MRTSPSEAAAARKTAQDLLLWVLQDDEILLAFLEACALSADDIRAQIEEPMFLAGLLDFILSQDRYVTDAAAFLGMDPLSLSQIRRALPGGDEVYWT